MPFTHAGQEYASCKWLGSQRNPTPEQAKQARENGWRLEAHGARRFAKWAKKNPEQAKRILEAQAEFAAANASERQDILELNNDAIGRAA